MRAVLVCVTGLVLGAAPALISSAAALDQGRPQPASQTLRIAQAKESPCLCRAHEHTFEEGQVTCLKTAEGPRLAVCGMVLNTMSWHLSNRPCPQS